MGDNNSGREIGYSGPQSMPYGGIVNSTTNNVYGSLGQTVSDTYPYCHPPPDARLGYLPARQATIPRSHTADPWNMPGRGASMASHVGNNGLYIPDAVQNLSGPANTPNQTSPTISAAAAANSFPFPPMQKIPPIQLFSVSRPVSGSKNVRSGSPYMRTASLAADGYGSTSVVGRDDRRNPFMGNPSVPENNGAVPRRGSHDAQVSQNAYIPTPSGSVEATNANANSSDGSSNVRDGSKKIRATQSSTNLRRLEPATSLGGNVFGTTAPSSPSLPTMTLQHPLGSGSRETHGSGPRYHRTISINGGGKIAHMARDFMCMHDVEYNTAGSTRLRRNTSSTTTHPAVPEQNQTREPSSMAPPPLPTRVSEPKSARKAGETGEQNETREGYTEDPQSNASTEETIFPSSPAPHYPGYANLTIQPIPIEDAYEIDMKMCSRDDDGVLRAPEPDVMTEQAADLEFFLSNENLGPGYDVTKMKRRYWTK
ncbi:unnamed protein product [Periconia digitata]|uniref:Uncharacterized protein n=1 Tax=Periconia digitata TaxID=1303443 RepID=A0A9W4XLL7_9PLEO|nr:unnamed protein product [Periconia digitata]